MAADQPSRKRDATATKAALLDAAAELFADRGFDRTTVRDIAHRAGVNQALLFRYFGSKDALFEHVMARGGLAQVETTRPSGCSPRRCGACSNATTRRPARSRPTCGPRAPIAPTRLSARNSTPNTPARCPGSPTSRTPNCAPTSRWPGCSASGWSARSPARNPGHRVRGRDRTAHRPRRAHPARTQQVIRCLALSHGDTVGAWFRRGTATSWPPSARCWKSCPASWTVHSGQTRADHWLAPLPEFVDGETAPLHTGVLRDHLMVDWEGDS